MNFAKKYSQQFIRSIKSGVKNLNLTERFNQTVEYYRKMKTKKIFNSKRRDRVQEIDNIERNSFIRSIFEVFGYTAVMSIPVLFIMFVLVLSFVLNTFLESFRGYGLLSLGISVLMLGIGWYKPYKIWSFILVVAGAFLAMFTFGPQVIEGYTGKTLIEVNWKTGYWITLKATLVFLGYLIGTVSLIAWVYLVSKGQRHNPLKRIRTMNIKQRLEQLKKLYTN